MPPGDLAPWMSAAIALLDVRRQDRVLACDIGVDHARSLATLVGKDGSLTVVCSTDDARQLAALDLPQVHVLAHRLTGDERFGTFDAMLMARATGPLLPLGAYPELARANLRPGGRLVIDLPGHLMVPDLANAWRTLGWDPERIAPLAGLADDALAEALRNAGLRNVHSVLGAHLVHLGTPGDLVQTFARALELDDGEQLQLTHELVRGKGGTGPFDALVHRTRLSALR
jgi:hypothetical protein